MASTGLAVPQDHGEQRGTVAGSGYVSLLLEQILRECRKYTIIKQNADRQRALGLWKSKLVTVILSPSNLIAFGISTSLLTF